MRAWTKPEIPTIEGHVGPPQLFDTPTGSLVAAVPRGDNTTRLYVCGITPYDATHIGHAATYLAYDTLQRLWRDAGYQVRYTQNVTDVDDPLLERATATGIDWRALADQQIDLFRADMESLSIIPPDDYVAVTETIQPVADAVAALLERGIAYRVPTTDAAGQDIYFDLAAAAALTPWRLGQESNLDRVQMLELSAERGGDPERAGKRDPLDPLLWRSARNGEPSWPSRVGVGRPGWHIECAVIALGTLGENFTVQGGGTDLIFPHHEMSAAHATALSGHPLAVVFNHTGLVGYQGAKMSKSLGNLVLVSELRERGVDPRAIRLALLANHYRSEWEWTPAVLETATARLAQWSAFAARQNAATAIDTTAIGTTAVVDELRRKLADDLDTPGALATMDRAVASGIGSSRLLVDAIDALLGVRL
ncbi:cysteine--1-D-myo-inosityl 2-amino-2-deoxy-alpha-D-glucopyranoside ligase [Rathayibacter soli]|uniref:cysteine--1-D-myo-inosityl 2-amino-2-deoxy-alpha-D-glucopyranoside ligase n=1 Tax=Rathayibacter soli TaxID=3144168 RepID=UPI0027E57A0F|nr:cysteine--1-D-myo-inosityl 2-amino-2-deoxy-alpha-D-glucopyranoside ligase [Glaciibacter superstes]